MALDLVTKYPGKVGAATPAFPLGEPRNVSAPSAGDGTPWDEALLKDLYGAWLRAFDLAGLVPSGVPDTALSSQFFDALMSRMLAPSDLISNGGTVLQTIDRGTAGYRQGITKDWVGPTGTEFHPGTWRNWPDSVDMTNSASMVKLLNATWAAGAGAGLIPAALFPLTADGWLRDFMVMKPDRTVDFAVDSSPIAANFFADPAAIAAGFTDNSLYRRVNWTFGLNGGSHLRVHQEGSDPTQMIWGTAQDDIFIGSLSSGARSAHAVPHAPPNTLARMAIFMNLDNDGSVLITQENQVDSPASSTLFTARLKGTPRTTTIYGDFQVNDSSELYMRREGATVDQITGITHGWVDGGLTQ